MGNSWCTEYPLGIDGHGDVDSGPLVFGFAGPAVVVGAAAAKVHGDSGLAERLLGVVEAVGFPIQLFGQHRYLAGLVPVGDAFIAWARSSQPRTKISGDYWSQLIPDYWYLPIHGLSLIFWLVVFFRARYLLRCARTLQRQPHS